MYFFLIVTASLCHSVNPFTLENSLIISRDASLTPAHFKKNTILQESGSNNSNDGNDGNYRQNVDLMRAMLESSWKEETMGVVPTTPQSAASNAAESVLNALSEPTTNVLMIDISLPSFDPMSGENIYDDVGAAEFCIDFAEILNDSRQSCDRLNDDSGTTIVVKDSSLLSRIERAMSKKDDMGGDDADTLSSIEFYDDFADFAGSSSIQPQDDHNDIDLQINSLLPEKIRLGSVLGNNKIENGKNMINDVVRSVAANGSPKKNEDLIIILAPISQQELVGVRWLVSKYGGDKTIIIFNNKLNPLPNELMMAETCYSVFPMIARSASTGADENSGKPTNPKIVLLRRFPRDWEIHIDSNEGSGFELAGSVPAVDVGMRGPSMDWIAGCVKRHMQSKLGQ